MSIIVQQEDVFQEINKQKSNIEEIRKCLAFYMDGEPNAIHELFSIWAGGQTKKNVYSKDINVFSTSAAILSDMVPQSVWFRVNAIKQALSDRITDKIGECYKSTRDEDIICIRNVIIDCDSIRENKNIMATEEERKGAWQRLELACGWLKVQGWSEPMILSSGSGYAAIYKTNILDTALYGEAVRLLYEKLNAMGAVVDTTCGNPARLYRVAGTWNRKGPNTPERPWRIARIISVPEKVDYVSLDKLIATSGWVKKEIVAPTDGEEHLSAVEGVTSSYEKFDKWLRKKLELAGVGIQGFRKSGDNYRWYLSSCPITKKPANNVRSTDLCVFWSLDKGAGYKNSHDGGKDLHWKELRSAIDSTFAAKKAQEAENVEWLKEAVIETEIADGSEEKKEKEFRPSRYATEMGAKNLFLDLYQNDLRRIYEWDGEWIRWDGCHWEKITRSDVVSRWMHPFLEEYLPSLGKDLKKEGAINMWAKWCRQCQSSSRVNGVMTLVGDHLEISVNKLNKNSRLFACKNAIIDLDSGMPTEADRGDYITSFSGVSYDPDADCPRFKKFISQVLINEDGTPNPELVDYMQRVLGYCLTPMTKEKCLFILHGARGHNGKTTLMNAVMNVLGEYSYVGPGSLFFAEHEGGNNEDEAGLYEKRLVITAETEKSKQLSAAKVKRLTGGDHITAMRKFQHQFTFSPTHKLFLLTNFLPHLDPSDEGLIQRVKLIPFHLHVEPGFENNNLPLELAAEASGILNWLLEGLRYWKQVGLGEDHTPDICKVSKTAYVVENDDLNDFEEKIMKKDASTMVEKGVVYSAYVRWCEQNGRRPLAHRNLTPRLINRGWIEKQVGHDKTRMWTGWTLKPSNIHF